VRKNAKKSLRKEGAGETAEKEAESYIKHRAWGVRRVSKSHGNIKLHREEGGPDPVKGDS